MSAREEVERLIEAVQDGREAEWLAAYEAEIRAEERAQWTAYFEAWASAVGATEFNARNVLRAMRGERPFGCAAAEARP